MQYDVILCMQNVFVFECVCVCVNAQRDTLKQMKLKVTQQSEAKPSPYALQFAV